MTASPVIIESILAKIGIFVTELGYHCVARLLRGVILSPLPKADFLKNISP
jgi:hypothetical protein